MEYWEFLLQKEGDQSWLPLDVSQVEILEGRYRVMAHSSQAQAPVQVQISQRLLAQVPPKRRTLRRQGKTNEDGLMVVMPFTRLSAGIWDIQCSAGDTEKTLPATADASGDQASGAWRYAIQLRIIAQGTDEDSDWFADEGTTPRGSTVPESPRSAASAPPPPSPAPVWPQIDLALVTDTLNQARQHLAVAPEAQQGGLYKIELSQTALVGAEGQPLGLTGQVQGVVAGESCSDMALVVRLLDPQTAEVLTLTPFALGRSALPTGINLTVILPPQLSTRLLVGEVGLVSLSAGTVNILALQGFTVTVDLSSLFDAIANRAESETDLDVVFPSSPGQARDEQLSPSSPSTETKAESSVNASTDWTLVDLPQSPPRGVPIVTLPRSSASLPPKIYYPSPHEAKTHRPTLPPTGNVKPSPKAKPDTPAPGAIAADSSSPPPPSPRDRDQEFPPSHSLVPLPSPATGAATQPTSGQALTLPPVVQRSTPRPDPAAASSRSTQGAPPPKVPLLPSHEAMGFKDLKLQERFWGRLNDLALNIQQDAHQKRAAQDAAEAQGPDPTTDDAEVPEATAPFVPFAGEVVIYDDADETLGASRGSERFTEAGDRQRPKAPSPDAEADIITPPVPDIDVPEGELVAGDAVMLTLRVPFHPNRLYIKVWLIDPQTRTLVDEPRQVMNLAPNGRGQLEGNLRLTVPMGCLEIWFEAITVDLMTQQESYKTTVSRSVTPAGLEPPSLEEFEL